MKDNSLDGHRGKVAIDDTKLQSPDSGKADSCVSGQGATNFDDDYNEWELGIGDLIIDLDADIEKNNEKNGAHHQNGNLSAIAPAGNNVSVPGVNLNPLSGQVTVSGAMSNPKSRMGGNGGSNGNVACATSAAAVEHQATVDKGLKMKIKRKNIGSKYSEAKHEIVQSDTKANSPHGSAVEAVVTTTTSQGTTTESKSKHSSSKGRSSGHRDKKEKNREKDRNKTTEVNGVTPANAANVIVASASSSLKIMNSGVNILSPTVQLGVPASLMVGNTGSNATASASTTTSTSTSTTNTSTTTTAVVSSSATASTTTTSTSSHEQCNSVASSVQTTNCSTSMPNLTVKLEAKFSPGQTANPSVILKTDDPPKSPSPPKRVKVESLDLMDSEDISSNSTEFKESSTCTSIGTITEPECLGPCEPGTSVLLEGIVWQETEGGVLVVNVTWRGKTYVGTLLDCTKHDWAPPRFCESPTSDMDTKAVKGRGKRGRGTASASSEATSNTPEPRASVQSKLRNGKGRRNATISPAAASGFTVPSSPARSENNLASKRKARPIDLELSPVTSEGKGAKRSRSQSRNPPTFSNNVEFPQPSSPLLIECPEPNCSKKYKHINGLRYHQTHAHTGNEPGRGSEDNDDCKDTTNSSDNEESLHEGASIPTSPVTPFARSASPTARAMQPVVDPPTLTPNPCTADVDTFTSDLSTLASVAISESAVPLKSNSPIICFSSVTSTPCVVTDSSKSMVNKLASTTTSSVGTKTMPSVVAQNNSPLQVSVPLSSPGSVIQSSGSAVMSSAGSPLHVTPSVTVSIPTLHVMSFNQVASTATTPSNSLPGNTTTTSSAIRSAPPMVSSSNSSVIAPVVSSLASTGISVPLSIDKSKLKPEKLDRHKSLSSVRPVLSVSSNIPPTPNQQQQQQGMAGMASSLKPIQPKPTILGEPVTLNPALESLKKEKSKHKKKSKDKERKIFSGVDGKHRSQCGEGERMDSLAYHHIAENINASRENVGSSLTQSSLSSSLGNSTARSLDLRVDASENSMNENVQSPAYSDISDANDTAPILESEVPSEKEKDEKTMKQASEATQSPSNNLSYGMYSYYGQPPYLIPSVQPQNASPSAVSSSERNEQGKKLESERHKEIKVWSAQAEMEKVSNSEQKSNEKKAREEASIVQPGIASNVPSASTPMQDFSLQQSYSYPYGYMQGYPYGVDPAYHMHLLANDPHYKQQHERLLEEQLYKEQAERSRGLGQQQQQNSMKDDHPSLIGEPNDRNIQSLSDLSGKRGRDSQATAVHHGSRDRDIRENTPGSAVVKLENPPPSIHSPITSLKEKQSENHQILKENIELKSQMDSAKASFSHYEAAAILERQREEMRRYLLMQDHLMEQQQKMEPEHQQSRQQQPFGEPLLARKEGIPASSSSSKNSSLETRASNCASPHKSDKTLMPSASAISSSPKGNVRESHSSKDLPHISSTGHSSNKKDTGNNSISSKLPDTNSEHKEDKSNKNEKSKVQSEGQKPTMETTGPPPPPTNSYAYLHPSYLQAPPPHFAPMAFDHGHPMYRGGISPIIMSAAPPYGSSPYLHQQLRYHVPTGPCELGHHAQPVGADPMAQKLHTPGPPKALDLLHQVSQHYTTHKIHELQERALMSPTSSPASAGPPSAPGIPHGKGSELPTGASKQEAGSPADRNRSPPPQRHLHTHHHTHVGVGYPLYDPYGVNQQWKQAQAQRRVPFRLTH